MSKYRQSDQEPETLRQMQAMMTQRKPAPQFADPTSIALGRIFRIYMAMKNKVLLGEENPDSIGDALREARAQTIKEVAHLKLRADAVARYDKMISLLAQGGEIQI